VKAGVRFHLLKRNRSAGDRLWRRRNPYAPNLGGRYPRVLSPETGAARLNRNPQAVGSVGTQRTRARATVSMSAIDLANARMHTPPRRRTRCLPAAVTVVDWLLDSDPAIRWQVLRDLTDASPGGRPRVRQAPAGTAALDSAAGEPSRWNTLRVLDWWNA
jgi:hypothetical protein